VKGVPSGNLNFPVYCCKLSVGGSCWAETTKPIEIINRKSDSFFIFVLINDEFKEDKLQKMKNEAKEKIIH
jgi:hypothetical protein